MNTKFDETCLVEARFKAKEIDGFEALYALERLKWSSYGAAFLINLWQRETARNLTAVPK